MQRRHFPAGIPAVLAACAAPPPRPPGTHQGQNNPLVGQHVNTPVDTYGEPDHVREIGTDRSAYGYLLGNPANTDGKACNDAYVINSQGIVIDYYCR